MYSCRIHKLNASFSKLKNEYFLMALLHNTIGRVITIFIFDITLDQRYSIASNLAIKT